MKPATQKRANVLAWSTVPLLLVASAITAPAQTTESSSHYDEDLTFVTELSETCEYNTFMCCFNNNGNAEVVDNTDVCRVLDYTAEGEALEFNNDEEGDVYCHGFAWELDADVEDYILPLYQFFDEFVQDQGYYGNVEGAPECGCIEEMPVVSDAECFRHNASGTGFANCNQESLRVHYGKVLGAPRGAIDFNLVKDCTNGDLPDFDFETCLYNTYMCCWTVNVNTNTDLCRYGDVEYPGDEEGPVHCHGILWPEGSSDQHIKVLAGYMQNTVHKDNRGYSGTIPDAPQCECVENMPEVSRSSCFTYKEGSLDSFGGCTPGNLLSAYEHMYPDGDPLPNIVRECDNGISSSS